MVGCTSEGWPAGSSGKARGKKDAATERQARFGNEEMVFSNRSQSEGNI